MIVVTGKTNSGKTTIVAQIIKLGFDRVVPYTTRPMREGEVDGEDYHYITNKEFTDKMGWFFAETAYYETVFGRWYYGTAIEDYNNKDSIAIINPIGLKSINDKNIKVMRVNIECSDDLAISRSMIRGDNQDEIKRRIEADKKDFKNIKNMVDYTIVNDGSQSIEKIAMKIIALHKEYNANK